MVGHVVILIPVLVPLIGKVQFAMNLYAHQTVKMVEHVVALIPVLVLLVGQVMTVARQLVHKVV